MQHKQHKQPVKQIQNTKAARMRLPFSCTAPHTRSKAAAEKQKAEEDDVFLCPLVTRYRLHLYRQID
jgi:hypothetical protein